ncbi:MAG: acylneuraminate cytidylyltransferase family protein [Candidatus Hydrogenedentota bacterium]
MIGNMLGVILARGGSKGLPRKHQLILGDKPMLTWTFEAAKRSVLLKRVIFSTDSEELAAMAREAGIEVPFLRPEELSGDSSSTGGALEHAVSFIEEKEGCRFDHVLTLQGTSPFRTGAHIDEAIRKFENSGCECLLSIKPHEYPAWWLFRTDADRLNLAFPWEGDAEIFKVGRQFFPQLYRPNGAIYIIRREFIRLKGATINPDSATYYLMDSADSVSIDTELDFMMAEAIWRRKQAL